MEFMPVRLKEIVFKSGDKIQIEKDDIIIIVGPNNSGKSKILEEITGHLQSPKNDNLIVDQVKIIKQGDAQSIINSLQKQERIIVSDTNTMSGKVYSVEAPLNQLVNSWNNTESLGIYSRLFVNRISTVERLTAVNPPRVVEMTTSAFTHPIHLLQMYDELENSFSEKFRQAFGQDLILNHKAGDKIPLHVGQRPPFEGNEDRVTLSYINKIK